MDDNTNDGTIAPIAPALPVKKPKKKRRHHRRLSDLEIKDRRQKVLMYRNRGMSLKQISNKLNISLATTNRDLAEARKDGFRSMSSMEKVSYVSETMATYDDLIRELWETVENAVDQDLKLKALNQVRQVTNDKRKALQDTGIIERVANKKDEVVVTVDWGEHVEAVTEALLSTVLPPTPDHLLPGPDPNIIEAEFTEAVDKEEKKK